jgi:hypothetical protein
MRCDQCRHWNDPPGYDESWEASEIGFKLCGAVRERWKIQDGVHGGEKHSPVDADAATDERWTRERKGALAASRAYVEDGSEYKALLWTGPDFFCAFFQKRD